MLAADLAALPARGAAFQVLAFPDLLILSSKRNNTYILLSWILRKKFQALQVFLSAPHPNFFFWSRLISHSSAIYEILDTSLLRAI
jgi:hypothetical protein